MEATFIVDLEKEQADFLERFMKLFAGKRIKIRVEELENDNNAHQREWYRQMEALQQQFPPHRIPSDIDISRLSDEMNDQPL
jgi:glycine cleavage system regulatory protein